MGQATSWSCTMRKPSSGVGGFHSLSMPRTVWNSSTAMEQLEQSPDPGTATEFALGQLQRGLNEYPAEELRVEVECARMQAAGAPVRVAPPPAAATASPR